MRNEYGAQDVIPPILSVWSLWAINTPFFALEARDQRLKRFVAFPHEKP